MAGKELDERKPEIQIRKLTLLHQPLIRFPSLYFQNALVNFLNAPP